MEGSKKRFGNIPLTENGSELKKTGNYTQFLLPNGQVSFKKECMKITCIDRGEMKKWDNKREF